MSPHSPQQRLADDLWFTGNDEAGSGGRKLAGRLFGAGLAGGLFAELIFAGYVSVDAEGGLCLLKFEPLRDHALDPVVTGLYAEEAPVRDEWNEQEKQAIRWQEEVLHQRAQWRRQQDQERREWEEQRQRPDGRYRHVAWQPSAFPEPVAPIREPWVPPRHDLRTWIAYLAAEHRPEDPEEPVTSLAETLVTRRLARTGLLELEKPPRLLRRSKTRYIPVNSVESGYPKVRLITALTRGKFLPEPDLFLAGLIMATGLHRSAFVSLNRDQRAACNDQLEKRFTTAGLRPLLDAVEFAVSGSTMSGRV